MILEKASNGKCWVLFLDCEISLFNDKLLKIGDISIDIIT